MSDDSSELGHPFLLISVGELIEDLITSLWLEVSVVKEPFTSDSPGENEVLLHDGHPVGMNGTLVAVFEQTNKVGLSSFLEGKQGLALESEIRIDGPTNGPDEPLEWGSGDQIVSGLLVLLDFSQSNSSWSPSSASFDTTFSGSSLLLGLASFLGALGHLGLGVLLSCNLLSGHNFE